MQYSERQKAVAEALRPGTPPYVCLEGSWRSGKTMAGLWMLAMHAVRTGQGCRWLLGFESWGQLQEIAREELLSFCDHYGIKQRYHNFPEKGTWWIAGRDGSRVRFVPLAYSHGKAKVEQRLWGKTIAGGLLDEGIHVPENIRSFVLSRISEGPPEARKMIFTSNPDSPLHPFHTWTDHMVEQGRMTHINGWTPDDNPVMDDAIRQALLDACGDDEWKIDRYFRGLRCEGPAGVIWPRALLAHPLGNKRRITNAAKVSSMVAAVDFGAKQVTHAVFAAVTDMGLWVVDECRLDGSSGHVLSERGQAEALAGYARQKGYRLADWIVDRTAPALRTELRRLGCHAIESDCGIHESIENVSMGLNGCRLWLDLDQTPELRKELDMYRLPPEANESYGDRYSAAKASAGGAHGVDALRYLAWKLRRLWL